MTLTGKMTHLDLVTVKCMETRFHFKHWMFIINYILGPEQSI